MKSFQYLLIRGTSFAFILAFMAASSPLPAFAAVSSVVSTYTSVVTAPAKEDATIDTASLSIDSGARPYLTGTTTDDISKIRVIITASSSNSGSAKQLYKSSRISVKSSNNTWSVHPSKKLADGSYTVSVYEDKSGKLKLLTQGTLRVGIPPATLRVQPIALLGGGMAHPNSIVPISYLDVVNQSTSTTTINGFWVEQDGSTPTTPLVAFISVDSKGTTYTTTNPQGTFFKNGRAYIPSIAVLAPGERRLFTLKTQLSAQAGLYANTSLMLNIDGIDTAAGINATLPIKGTTWLVSAY